MSLIEKPLGVAGAVLGIAAFLMSGVAAKAATGGTTDADARATTTAPDARQDPANRNIDYDPAFEGVSDGDLLDLLKSASQLFTLKDRPPVTVAALERRAQNDLERLREVLRSEGYYDAALNYRIATDERPIVVTIDVEPGERYMLASFTVEYEPPAPDAKARPTLGDIGIKTGMPARAPDVRSAEAKAAAWLRTHGYPFAKAVDLKATVRHDKGEMSVRLTLNAGQPAKLGALRLTGLETVEEDYVRRIIDWPEGEPFDQNTLNDVRSTLNDTGLFSSIRISHPDTVSPDGTLPVTVTLAESPHRSIGFGLSYSTDIGFGGDVSWEHRNFFGRNETIRFGIKAAQIEQSGSVRFRKPAFLQREQSLLATATIGKFDTDAYDQKSIAGTVSLERPLFEKWRGTAGLSASYDIIDDDEGERRFKLLGLPLSMTRNTADSPLNPTKGTKIDLNATPYGGAANSPIAFLKMSAGGSAYYSIDKKARYILAGRTRVGSIVGEKTDVLPADKRFYAGGGGSVRGYGYQMVGPLDDDGDPTGGRSLFELGAELRIRVTKTIGVVPFIDGGMVTEESYPSFDEPLLWAGGLGLRYYTDIGPLRLDVAFPINRREEDDFFQFYVSFGQAF